MNKYNPIQVSQAIKAFVTSQLVSGNIALGGLDAVDPNEPPMFPQGLAYQGKVVPISYDPATNIITYNPPPPPTEDE